MPTDEAPTQVNEPDDQAGTTPDPVQPDAGVPVLSEEKPVSPVVRGSRWLDYDTHELLQMITELEDERRWARLRGDPLPSDLDLGAHLASKICLQGAASG